MKLFLYFFLISYLSAELTLRLCNAFPADISFLQLPKNASLLQFPTKNTFFQLPKNTSFLQFPKNNSFFQYSKNASFLKFPTSNSFLELFKNTTSLSQFPTNNSFIKSFTNNTFLLFPTNYSSYVFQLPKNISLFELPKNISFFRLPTNNSFLQLPKNTSFLQFPANVSVLLPKNTSVLQFPTNNSFLQLRKDLINNEKLSSFGGRLKLVGDEILANECLMAVKYNEVDEGFKDPHKFLPSKNFLEARKQIDQSEIFKILRQMPKGSVFHAHSTSVVSLDYIFHNITYLPNLYICYNNSHMRFRFFEKPTPECQWKLLKDLRDANTSIDYEIQKHLSIVDESVISSDYNIDSVWKKFNHIFVVIKGLITYRPVFETYLYRAMQELYDDKIMYIEFRSALSKVYEINGTMHDAISIAKMYQNVINRFKEDYPNFIGAKVIYSPHRDVTEQLFDHHVNIFRLLKKHYPDLFVGFDLVGQEDKDHTLLDFADKLIELGKETPFFFHAGETNWYGHSADENLVDAVLLNTKRIGHGFALPKHPKLMEMVKRKDIAIELNPISNQVLGLVKDMRNHPASYLFAENFSIVVSNDDPSFWGATGLSHDFYEAFVGIMSRDADLKALKQLAINSIIYSTMNSDERIKAFKIWQTEWANFVTYLAHEYKCVHRNI